MHRPVFALWERALRHEMRSLPVCLARAAVPTVSFFSLWGIQQLLRFQVASAPGRGLFTTLVLANFWVITIGGLSHFASAITEEKEEQMLGLLRMTDLSPVAILLGKSTSRLFGAGLLLVAQVPFTLLAYSLGGVSVGQVVAAYVALGAYLVLLANLALLGSVVFRRTVTAAAVTGVLLFLAGTLPAGAAMMYRGWRGASGLPPTDGWTMLLDALAAMSPVTALAQITATGFTAGPFSLQVWGNLAGGGGCFLLAWGLFERFCRSDKDDSPRRVVIFRRSLQASRVPPRVMGAGAITWKDFQFLSGGWRGTFIKFFAIGLIIAGVCAVPSLVDEPVPLRPFAGATMMVVGALATGVALAVDASRLFKVEVRWQTLSGLMMLPYSVREVAYRKVAGCLLGLLPTVAWVVIGGLLVFDEVLKAANELLRDAFGFSMLLGMTLAVVQAVMFLHLVAYLSLVVKRGALPLAFLIQYVGGMFTLGVIGALFFNLGGGAGGEVLVFLGVIVTAIITWVLHRAIGRRLVLRACQE